MKIKFAIEFETEVPFGEDTNMIYHQDDIENIVYACALNVTTNSKLYQIIPTGEWRYIAENDGKEEYIQGVFDEWMYDL